MHGKGPWARGVRVAVIAHQLRMDEISLSKTTTWNQLEEDKFSFTPTEIQLAFSWVNGQCVHSSTTSRIFFFRNMTPYTTFLCSFSLFFFLRFRRGFTSWANHAPERLSSVFDEEFKRFEWNSTSFPWMYSPRNEVNLASKHENVFFLPAGLNLLATAGLRPN